MPHWILSFGASNVGVFADAILYFLVAILLMTYLGAGLTALLVPLKLRSAGWMVAPYLGYALLATVSGLAISVSGNVTVSLVLAVAIATALNGVTLLGRRQGMRSFGNPRLWLLLLGLALPSYLITAASMANSGTLGYVGPSSDPVWFIRLAEWLKTHSSPVFSAGSQSLLDPWWNASFPPMDGWFRPDVHMGFRENPYDESYWVFSRGPRYLEAAIGIILGWDSALVFRAAQALMLSLAIPATYLFCRQTVRTDRATSLLAALLVGINSTTYFWAYLGHPGQTSWTFLLPVSLCVALAALDSLEKRSLLAASLLIAAHFISYYQATPALPVIASFGFLYLVVTRPGQRLRLLAAAIAMAIMLILLALPDHVRMLATQLGGGMYQAVGWGDPGFAQLGDALGSSISDVALAFVSSKGQMDKASVDTLQGASTIATAIALLFTCVGLAVGRAAGMRLYRLLFLGDLLFLEYLQLTNFRYGHVKLQSMTTFLFCVALAIGIVEALRWTRGTGRNRLWNAVRRLSTPVPAVTAAALVLFACVNLGVLAGSYWKMDRNLFNTALWEGAALPGILPTGAATRVSPGLIGEPQTLFFANYFLHDQEVRGPFALEWILQRLVVLPREQAKSPTTPTAYDLLGSSEVASVYGLAPSDLLWQGEIMKLYRRRAPNDRVDVEVRGQSDHGEYLPTRLPATVRLMPKAASPQPAAVSSPTLVVAILSEGPTTVQLSTPNREFSLQLGGGLSVRTIPVEVPDQVILSIDGNGSAALLSARVETGKDSRPSEYYPRVMAISGSSELRGNEIYTRLTHFDDQLPAAHSIDVFDPTGVSHEGWYSLPPLQGGKIREIEMKIDGLTLEQKLSIDGTPFEPQRSLFPGSKPDPNGMYVGYLSTTYGGTNPNRIPLFRYRLTEGRVTEFEPFQLLAAWDDGHTKRSWK
jgi:hypothetical protein